MDYRTIALIVAVAALALAGREAVAQGDSGWYATIQAGLTGYDDTLRDDSTWWSRVNDRDGSLAFGVGYDFAPGFGLRLMHERTSELDARNRCPESGTCPAIALVSPTDASNWSLVARAGTMLADRWEAYMTLGAQRWRLRTEDLDTVDGVWTFADGSGTTVVFGPGLTYRLDDAFGVGVEYQYGANGYSSLRATFTIGF